VAAGHGQRVVQHALAQPARKVLQQSLVRASLQANSSVATYT
jgi:hypothetical protein